MESSKERVLFYKRLYAFPTRNVTVHRSRPHFSRVRVHHMHSSAMDSKSHYPWQCCLHVTSFQSNRQSLLKYNSRMAQTTQWLQAIQSCMKKVRLNISIVSMSPRPLRASLARVDSCAVKGRTRALGGESLGPRLR